MTYKVDKKVPIPEQKTYGGNRTKYPWAAMGIGDSFFKDCTTDNRERIRNQMQSVVRSRMAFHKDEKYVLRGVEGGFRVWRVK